MHFFHLSSFIVLFLSLLTASCGGGGGDNNPAPVSGSGDLDKTFSGDGVLVFNSGLRPIINDDWGNAIKIDTSGRLIVAGYTHNFDGNFDMVVVRYLADGTLDTTFGGDYNFNFIRDGFVKYDSGVGAHRSDEATSLYVYPDGSILVAGTSPNGTTTSDLILLRFNSSGDPDTTFGTNGVVTHNNAAGGDSADAARGVTVDRNGKIVVVGHSSNAAGNYDLVVWRFLNNGNLDVSFGGDYDSSGAKDGFFIHDNAAGGNGNDFGSSIVIDSLDRIIVAGSSSGTGTPIGYEDRDFVIWRLIANGDLDTTFGGDYNNDSIPDGYTKFDGQSVPNSYDILSEVKIDISGNIIAVGSSYNNVTGYDMILFSYTATGELNTEFGGDYDDNGIKDGLNVYGGAGTQAGNSIDFDTHGNIVVAGYTGNYELATWRYTGIGDIDASFGNNGVTVYTTSPFAGRGHQVQLDQDDKLVIAGIIVTGGASGFDLALWRLLP